MILLKWIDKVNIYLIGSLTKSNNIIENCHKT